MKASKLINAMTMVSLLAALAACGRAGPLEPPPSSVSKPAGQETQEPSVEEKPFVLDALLN
ncbi:lipoprotein [Ahrensia sp. 13_GOM-1096m]|uniref:LPS translocon maturation chaperone LptM n=1 Tax=Ahrensia sp. 13_GOM-1096m TaxID=1380380 RepID=UPI0004791E42|nr:lipoprotein [Ahrensia sp. 13_GOM-1096m]